MRARAVGMAFYVGAAVRRRLRETWAIHLTMVCLGAFVSVVVGLRAVIERQATDRLLARLAPEIGRATGWLVAMGVAVVVVQTWLLVQRATAVRAQEFQVLLHVGIARSVVVGLVALEYAAYAVLGGGTGTLFGVGLCLALGPLAGVPTPSAGDIVRAFVAGVGLPLVGLVPGGLSAVWRLLGRSWRDEDG
jgi:hypothetical protein